MNKILIIEDDPAILRGLQAALSEEHYKLTSASDGQEGFELALKQEADLIILDIMLPSKNGCDICRDLRAEKVTTPILMLTSKREEMDRVLGLELGADDYVTKPFSLKELKARIKALLRRAALVRKAPDRYKFGRISVDFVRFEATRDGQPVKLSAREFEILRYFIAHESELVSRDMLLDEVWGYDVFPTTRTVDTFILNLRKKIEDDPAHPRHLITLHKAGYKFVP